MNDSRFIELLNLYVDQQLTPAEARELEAELHANPARQRTYLQYCRMQKACAQLFETERAHAPAHPRLARALAEANRKITEAPYRTAHRWWRNPFAIGGLAAAAACVAAVFVLQKNPQQPDAVSYTSAPAVATITQPETTAIAVDTAPQSQAPAPTVTNERRRFRLPAITSLAADQNTRPAPLIDESVFNWTKELQFRPIRKVSTEETIKGLARFQIPKIGSSILRMPTAETQETASEMTAIEFKR